MMAVAAVDVMEATMAVTLSDETRLKALLKEALVEVLEQRREWFSALMAEALEDIALVQAIKEGETTEMVSRDEIFALLGAER
jgi:Cu/Ag efflux protein CusF